MDEVDEEKEYDRVPWIARSTGTVARAAAARGVKALRVGRDIVLIGGGRSSEYVVEMKR